VENPLARGIDFNLSVPSIEVRMVNASSLTDYEIWIFCASLAFGGFIGFVVAFLQSIRTIRGVQQLDLSLGVLAALCLILFLVFLVRALVIRRQISRDTHTFNMTASERVQ